MEIWQCDRWGENGIPTSALQNQWLGQAVMFMYTFISMCTVRLREAARDAKL